MRTNIHFLSYLTQFFLEWEKLRTQVVQKIKAHFMFNNFFSENHGIYEVMWKNIVQPNRPQMTIWRMACWMPKGTNTHTHTLRICNTYYFSTATMVAQMRLNVTLYVSTLPVLFYFLMMDCSSYSNQGSYQKQSSAYQMKHSYSQNFARFFLKRLRIWWIT
jgi:hypothetical protein